MRDIIRALDQVEHDLQREVLRIKSIQDQVLRIRSELGHRVSRKARDPSKRATKFDKLIDILRHHGRQGLRIGELLELMISQGEDISYNAVSSYLTRAKKNGLATKRKPYWYPVLLNDADEEKVETNNGSLNVQ